MNEPEVISDDPLLQNLVHNVAYSTMMDAGYDMATEQHITLAEFIAESVMIKLLDDLSRPEALTVMCNMLDRIVDDKKFVHAHNGECLTTYEQRDPEVLLHCDHCQYANRFKDSQLRGETYIGCYKCGQMMLTTRATEVG